MRDFVALRGRDLTERELGQLRELDEVCSRHEPLSLKLNWEMLEERPAAETNDFLYYDDNGRLVGFLGLYGLSSQAREIEVTGMVHPDYRRQGIFGRLFAAGERECRARGVERLLLISERASAAGIVFAKKNGAYAFSEYRMRFSGDSIPDFPRHGLELRGATVADLPVLQQLDADCFGLDEAEAGVLERERLESSYVVELAGRIIGKIGALREGEDGYIFGFGIYPEHRGLGYGREALSLMLQRVVAQSPRSVLLEVAVQNERALSLYKSCGFKEVTVYDYYEIVL